MPAQPAAIRDDQYCCGVGLQCVCFCYRLEVEYALGSDRGLASVPRARAIDSHSTLHFRVWAFAIHLDTLRSTDPEDVVTPDQHLT
jgi:hypothetical protein